MAVRNLADVYLVGHQQKRKEHVAPLRLARDAADALRAVSWVAPALPYFPKRTTRRHRA